MNLRFSVITMIAFLTISANTPTAQAAEGDLKSIKVAPQPFLGLSFPGPNLNVYRAMSEGGLGVTRTNIAWNIREPRPGQYSWKGQDDRIAHLQQLGIDPFLTFESNAPWAVRPETRELTNGTPRDLGQWVKFVKAAVERYDGDGKNDAPGLRRPVRYFQFANEWLTTTNKAGGWAGSTNELVEFLNASYDAVKAQSPEAIVVLGGISSGGADILVLYEGHADYNVQSRGTQRSRMSILTPQDVRSKPKIKEAYDRLTAVTKNARYDMADIHLYGPVDRDPIRIKAYRGKIGNRDLVSAECGGPSLAYSDRYVPEDHFMAVVDRNLTILSEGLKFCLWFRLGEGEGSSYMNSVTALFDKRQQPKPGYWASRLLAAALEGMTRVEKRRDNAFVIHRKGTSPLVVAWADGAGSEKVVQVPANMSGDVLTVTNPVAGKYSVAPIPASRSVRVGRWPVIVGSLPKSLVPSR